MLFQYQSQMINTQ